VQLPPYFDLVNKDPRYQLTAIGSFAQAIVWKVEKNNQFTIRTSQPGVQVSWQVSALRNDPWQRAHPEVAEQLKPAGELGRYVYPQGYGKRASLGIGWLPPHPPARPAPRLAPPQLPQLQMPRLSLPRR
jgi:hypothetical protein